MILTIEEIKDLAEFAGLNVGLCDVEPETEFVVYENSKGITITDDLGSPERYRVAAWCDGCDHNEMQPLGKPIDS